MARNRRGKMALYEVMSKARLKAGYGRTLENMRTDKAGEDKPAGETDVKEVADVVQGGEVSETADVAEVGGSVAVKVEESSEVPVRWRRKPRVVQVNAGRIELSLPFPIAIAIGLGLAVVILLAFRAGQWAYTGSGVTSNNVPAGPAGNYGPPVIGARDVVGQGRPPVTDGTGDVGNAATGRSTGRNVIVLVEHGVYGDLVPAQQHFANNGVATEILNLDGRYFLITKDRFDDFTVGGDGTLAKQEIARVGALYKGKAPAGFETFAPHYFRDAYGKKVTWE